MGWRRSSEFFMQIRSLAALTVLALSGGTAAWAQPADAAPNTLYVNNALGAGCSDSGSGTQDQPYCTLQAAAAAVQPGQTVEVSRGTYKGEVDITRSGTADAPITFTANPRGRVNLNDASEHDFVVSGAHDVVIRGFSMTNTAAVVVADSSRVTLDQNMITSRGSISTRASAISVSGQSSDVTVSRNLLSDAAAPEVTVGPGVTGTVVTTNQMGSNGGSGVLATDAPGTVVTSNTINDACAPVIALGGASSGSTVENNVVVDNGVFHSRPCATDPATHAEMSVAPDSTSQTTYDYNLVQPPSSGAGLYDWAGTSYADTASFQQTSGQGSHDIVADPGPAEPGYQLAEGSPAVDSADAQAPGELPTDMSGDTPADDLLVADTGTGSITFRDRGAHEFEDPYKLTSVTLTGAATPQSDGGPLPITVKATATENNPWSAPVTSYAFDFGDGSAPVVSRTPTADHTYTSPALGYNVTVTATTADGTRSYAYGYVDYYAFDPLTPVLKVTGTGAATPLTVRTDTSASGGIYVVIDHQINYGDGTPTVDAGTAFTDTHTYGRPGTYTITLTETDDDDHTASTTAPVTVRYTPVLSLASNASSYAYGATATVTAHLGATYSNRTVSIYAQPYGGTKTLVKTGTVDSHGNLVSSYKVTRNTTFTAAFTGDSKYAPARASRTAYGHAKVSESQSGYYTSTHYGSTLYRVYHHTAKAKFNTSITPNKRNQCLIFRLQKYYSGAWHTQSTSSCHALSSASTGYLTLTLGSGAVDGKYRMAAEYVHSSKDTTNLSTWSAWQYFTVRK